MKIEIDDPALRDVPVGGTFQTSPAGVEALLTMLHDGFGATIRRDEPGHVYIEGSGELKKMSRGDFRPSRVVLADDPQVVTRDQMGGAFMTTINGSVRKAVVQALACASGLIVIPGLANADPAQFDIVAQPLPNALKAFAAQAKMQLLYRYDIVSRANASAVAGKLEKHAALDQMLRGTGLEAVYSNENTATIRLVATRCEADRHQGRHQRETRAPPALRPRVRRPGTESGMFASRRLTTVFRPRRTVLPTACPTC